MTKNSTQELLMLNMEYGIIHGILDALKSGKGKWLSSKEAKKDPPKWPTENSVILFMCDAGAIVETEDGKLYVGDCGMFECEVSDKRLLELIETLRPKTKKSEKKKTTPEKLMKALDKAGL